MFWPLNRKKIKWIVLLLASVIIHLVFFSGIKLTSNPEPSKPNQQLKVRLVEKEKPVPEELPEAEEVPSRPKPQKEKKPKTPETRTPKKKPVDKATKVQGVTTDSVIEGSSVAVPLGNTLMKEDLGKRLSPDELASLKKDLSSDALLIKGSFVIPEYTQPALDANLEGKFIVDVFVNIKGEVLETELRKKIGYGLDELVLEASRSARFFPRKNAKGVPIPGWSEIVFYLEIP